MSFPKTEYKCELPDEILKVIEKTINKQVKKSTEVLEESLHTKNRELSKLNERIASLIRANESLMRELKFKNKENIGVEDRIKKESESMEEHMNWILDSTPAKGWHVGEVWGRASNRFPGDYTISAYVITHSANDVSAKFGALLHLIDRYSREVEKYDANLNRWAKQIVIGETPEISNEQLGTYYHCPTTGRRCSLSFVDKIFKGKEFEMSGESIKPTVYPKVKVSA